MTLHITLATLILLLIYLAVAAARSGPDLPESVILVKDNQPHNITSEGFPGCCTPMKYIIKQAVDYKRDSKYWKLLFTDVDIPPFSQLMIYGLKNNGSENSEKIPIRAARYLHGVWIRPVVLFQGDALMIEFLPQQKLPKAKSHKKDNVGMYTGFKAVYWLDKKAWELDKPFTVCPPIDDAMEGGRVTLDRVQIPLDPQHYRLHCVWQLKPVPESDLQIYITVENLSGTDSSVKVHGGLTSASPVIFSSSAIKSLRTFTSRDGFYIELSKPTDQDSFNMTYGVYKTLLRTDKCVFQVDGKSVEGFRCEEVEEDFCIPKENVCDRIQDCPSGGDENSAMCHKYTTPAAVTMTSVPSTIPADCPRGHCKDGQCPRKHDEVCPEDDCGSFKRRCKGTLRCVGQDYESCPGEPCGAFLKTCTDGSCKEMYEECPEDCPKPKYKWCQNGECILWFRRCPGDPCPDYKPFECDGDCKYASVKCDGMLGCLDGKDERHCGLLKSQLVRFWKGLSALLLIVPLVACVCFIKYKCKRSKSCKAGKSDEGTLMDQSRQTNALA